MKNYLYTLLFLFTNLLYGQKTIISGIITDESNEPLIGATILEIGTENGTITDTEGKFTLTLKSIQSRIAISFTGYKTDTLSIQNKKYFEVVLKESTEALEEIVISSSSTFFDNLESKHVEIITEAELLKAACCNLSESFETNASVDVSFSDGISGTKTIRMLGLDGKYVQINRENIPLIRGLIGRQGLSFVPGTWIQSIDVGKGAGSVVNGYESMTGQINLEFKKPEIGEKLYLNAYVNSFGRTELNANTRYELNEKWSSALLVHADYLASEIDNNEDGFMDLPKSRQLNILNRYKFESEKLVSQIGINFMSDQKAGGQLGFGFGDDHEMSPEYGYANQVNRLEVFGKTGLLFPTTPYKGWGFIYSVSYNEVNSGFGRNTYSGNEKTGYLNVINQNIIGNTFHQYKTGVSFLYDEFEESYNDSTFQRTEIVPGAYFEYSFLPTDDFTLVAGGRVDYNSVYGTFWSPRVHTRYQFDQKNTLRVAAGKGYRVPNPFIEGNNFLFSSRNIIVSESPDPEESWNLGTSLVSEQKLGERNLTLIFDYFYTNFQNQLIYDLDQNSRELNIYNLNGNSRSHSFQIESKYEISDNLSAKAAYKYYDVQTTINGELMEMPFISRDRVFANIEYATKYDKWKVDGTLQWFGQKRLPDTSDKPLELQAPSVSEDYFLVNSQISRGFRWGNIYLGVENLFNFTQENPILDAENPFGENFDASIVWAPIAGRMFYTGIRYKIK